ncbi:MAG: FAD-binding protein [Hungatella hathewayi]
MRKAKQAMALAMTAALAAGLMSGCSTKKAAVEEPTTAQETTAAGTTAAEEPETTAAQTVTYDEEKNADVIIVGAGGAGLSAAIAAVDAGAKSVIIVEKLGKTGGSLNFTSGSMSGAETIIQELDGIEDTKESYVQDILSMEPSRQRGADSQYGRDVDMIQWLWDHGLSDNEFSMQNDKRSVFAPEHQLYSIQRTYKPKVEDKTKYKSAVHEILDTEVAGYKEITIDFYTEITELVGNDKGQVLTAIGTNSDTKKTVRYNAEKGIIMATGGYSGNPKMMGTYAKNGESYLVGGADSADGKGIRIMQMVGATWTKNLSYIPSFPMGLEFAEGKGSIGDVYTWKTGGIYVNQEGKRFVNETLDEVVPRETALEEQTNAVQYNIFTDKIVEDLIANNAATMWNLFYAPEDGIGHKLIQSASSIEELAGKIGVPADALQKTVDDYNTAVDSKGTDEFGRDFSGTKTAYNLAVNKIEGDTYYAVPIKALVVMTLGGVTVNKEMQVVDDNGAAIPGLYAAGEVVGGIWGKYVSGGTGVMGPVVFGKIAAQNVMNLDLAEGKETAPSSFVLDESLFEAKKVEKSAYDMTGLKDGSYKATVDGQNGPMTVSVTVTDGKLAEVTIVATTKPGIRWSGPEKYPPPCWQYPDVDGVTGPP